MVLPSRPRSRTSLPGGATTSAALPRGTRAVLPPGSLYEPPPLAHFSGVGTLSAVAIPCTTAVFTGSGGLAAIAAPVATAGFAGEGTFSVPTNDTNADFAGAGTLTATAIPCATAVFTGAGILSAGVVATATAPFSGSGTLTGPAVPSATAAFTSAGTLSATAVVFTPSGMNKNGSYTMTTSYAEVPAWTADTATYPGSTLSGNGLVAQATISNATVTAQIAVQLPGNSQTQNVDIQFYRNGSLIGTAPASPVACPVNATTNVLGTLTGVSLTAGDVITIRTKKTNSFSATVVATNTWVRLLPP